MTARFKARLKEIVARGERGVTAVVVAFSMVLLMAAGAFGYDIAKLYYARQQLRTAIDAAAQAAASALPDTAAAKDLAVQYANWNFPTLGLTASDVTFYCVVRNAAGTAVGGYPDPAQVGASRTCEGVPGWTNASAKCSDTSCAIPCNAGQACNSISIQKTLTVQFVFGPAIDVPSASTGMVQTLSCNGSCGGTPPPNPMDVVVMGDRTASMSSTAVSQMKQGIEGMLGSMVREQQYVAFGAIHKSTTDSSGCVTAVNRGYYSKAYDAAAAQKTFVGSWVPQAFSNTYTTGSTDTNDLAVNASDSLYKAVDCMKEYSDLQSYSGWGTPAAGDTSYYPSEASTGYGTHLASALKGAARYLYGSALGASNNLSSLPDRTAKYGTARKVIILETDGRPEELFDSTASALSLNNSYDIGRKSGSGGLLAGEVACNNMVTVANEIKAMTPTPLVITIGYGNATKYTCGKSSYAGSNGLYNSGSMYVDNVLASVASPKADGSASLADKSSCTAENIDGDNYYCADGTSVDLSTVFLAALGSMKGGTKFMSIGGVGD